MALLALIVASRLAWPADALLPRYDALLIAAIALQAALLRFGWETWDEAKAIAIFHVVGTVMEIFKTAAGAWVYPEAAYVKLGGVPLFTGFMYSAVGSYIARCWRLFDLRLLGAPPFWAMAALAAAIYVNFYSQHYVGDIRAGLFIVTTALFLHASAEIRVDGWRLRLPLLAVFVAVGALIWTAENIATWANVWLYPAQHGGWRPVATAKLGSWSLLMIVSFVLVAALHRAPRSAP